MLDMMKMLGKMKEVQAKIKEAQDNLVNVTTTGESGGGMVKAVVNGKKQVVKLEIDKEIINSDDQVMLQDLIIAAINKGLDEAEIIAKEEMKKSTSGVLPNIPGLDLSGII
jgi:nucleoid-associated protein EbfC